MPKWSQIVAQSPLKTSIPPITTEITLHLSEPATRKAVALLSNQAIVQTIQAGKSFACKKVLAARKLPSGDIRIFVPNAQTRADLLKDQEWTAGLGQEIRPNQQLYSVLVHNIPLKGIDPAEPQATSTL